MTARTVTDTDKHVSRQIRAARKSRSLTMQDIADKLGCSYQQVAKYETGFNRVSAGTLYEISEILDVPVARFFPVKDGEVVAG